QSYVVDIYTNNESSSKNKLIVLSYMLSILSAVIVYLSGGTNRVYPNLMYFPIAIMASTSGKKHAVLHAIISGLLIGPIMPLEVASGTMQSPVNWLIRTLFFVLVAFIISFFVDYYIKEHKDLQASIKQLQETTAAKERIESELKIAHKIQASMLPRIFPPFPDRTEFDIYASMTPAKEVGGDFFDFFLVDENKVAIVIGDVSGKGVPAALFMVIAKTLIKNEAQQDIPVDEIFYNVNNSLCKDNEELLFVTSFIAILDLKTGKLEYSNAGHNPPIIKTKNNECEYLKMNNGFVLGGMTDFEYKREVIDFNSGDIIYIYTDGITEAMNNNREQYSTDRLLNTFNNIEELEVENIENIIKADVNEFVGDAPQYDDYTMLVLKYLKDPVN
ncbi:MAG: PP2C family protein-serine/threonine phosphatase, partial [Bacillota bacterium]